MTREHWNVQDLRKLYSSIQVRLLKAEKDLEKEEGNEFLMMATAALKDEMFDVEREIAKRETCA